MKYLAAFVAVLIALPIVLLVGAPAGTPTELPEPLPALAAQTPGGGTVVCDPPCDASGGSADMGLPGMPQLIMFEVRAFQDGACAKNPGPSSPCDKRVRPCGFEILCGGELPFGYGLTGTAPGENLDIDDLGESQGDPDMHVWDASGDFYIPCHSIAFVTFNIVDERGYVVDTDTVVVDCDDCPN